MPYISNVWHIDCNKAIASEWLVRNIENSFFSVRDSANKCIIIHNRINAMHLFNVAKSTKWLIQTVRTDQNKKYELTKKLRSS